MSVGLAAEMKQSKENTGVKDQEVYRAAFEVFKKGDAVKKAAWLHPVREKAFKRFLETGFPTLRHEDWKYTSVDRIAKAPFRLASESPAAGQHLKKLEPFLFTELKGPRLVFVNGFYSRELSIVPTSLQGLVIGSLAAGLAEPADSLKAHLARYADPVRNGFIALNTAFLQDGVWIHLAKGLKLREPVQILYVTDSEAPCTTFSRNLILLEAEARAVLVESFISLSENASLTNRVSEVILERGASLDYYQIQKESAPMSQVNTTEVAAHKESSFRSFYLTCGSKLVRNDLNVLLKDEEAQCSLKGLYLTDQDSHVDNHTVIDHARPYGKSDQLYKGILKGKSRAVFNGKVFVRKDAQKTDAHQVNKNLLLSEGATVDTKPQLEIFADDVKCAHGAAIGQLDEESVFYLKSRGLNEQAARGLLTYAFASEVIQQVSLEAVRAQLDRWLWEWLKA